MRALHDCITTILEKVPDTEEALIHELCDIRKNSFAHAVEQTASLWEQTEQLLMSMRTFTLADTWLNECMYILTDNKYWLMNIDYGSLESRPLRVAASLIGFVNSEIKVLLGDVIYWCMYRKETDEALYLMSYILDNLADKPFNTQIIIEQETDFNEISQAAWIKYRGYSLMVIKQ